MTSFTYQPPGTTKFIYTLRKYLQQIGKDGIANLLTYSSYKVVSSRVYSYNRWDEYNAKVKFIVPLDSIKQFTEQVKKDLLDSDRQVFPSEVGYFISELEIIPSLKNHQMMKEVYQILLHWFLMELLNMMI